MPFIKYLYTVGELLPNKQNIMNVNKSQGKDEILKRWNQLSGVEIRDSLLEYWDLKGNKNSAADQILVAKEVFNEEK